MIEQIRAARGEVRRAELHPFSQGQTNRQGGAQMAKYLPIYMFSDDTTALEAELKAEGEALKNLLGGKGSNLNIMTRAGLPVPPGFTVTTEQCIEYTELGRFADGLEEQIRACVAKVEDETGKEFGNPDNPLLVSVRSGARSSMPGMMDTVLNIGLNDDVAQGLIKLTGNERFVWDAYRRLIMMFGDVVMGVHRELFEECFKQVKAEEKVTEDTKVSVEGLKKTVAMEKEVYKKALGEEMHSKLIENKKVEWDRFRTHVSHYEIERYLPIL